MSYLESIILGLIQGLTEFLPVSSSGHLVLAQNLFGVNESGISFEIIVHLGSLLAVLIFFYKDIFVLIKSLSKIFSSNKTQEDKSNLMIISYLLFATIVTAILGLIFKDYFTSLYDMPLVVAGMLIFTGIILYLSDITPEGNIETKNIGFFRAIFIGLGQALAIIPGISRSGTTIAFSLFAKMKRSHAARFSFLLSIPAILGAAVLDMGEMSSLNVHQTTVYLSGAVAAFVSGFAVIAILIKLIQKKQLKFFSFYCWMIAIAFMIYTIR